jgi:hypothetical protein
VFAAIVVLVTTACGPVPPPENAYTNGPSILKDLEERRRGVTSFRVTGRVDDFGGKHRIQGKTYLFAVLPKKLRIELVSPFGNPLNVLTINDDKFAIHDLREGKYLTGPAEPCNIAKFVRIPMPPEDVVRILVGHTPLMAGKAKVTWDTQGFYRVSISDGERTQHLEIGGDHETLPLSRSRLEDAEGTVFDITYGRWQPVDGHMMPHEIRVKMPLEKAHILVRYDKGGVELNVELPEDAWSQTPPPHLTPELVTCD